MFCLYASPHRAEFAILSTVAFCGTVRPELFAPPHALEASLFCCIRCIHRGAPQAVSERAIHALVALYATNPARVSDKQFPWLPLFVVKAFDDVCGHGSFIRHGYER